MDIPSAHMWARWVPQLGFESIVFGLAIVKTVQVARNGPHTPKVLVVLLRDSVVYFGGILAILIANLAVYAAARVRTFPTQGCWCTHILRSSSPCS